MIRALTLAAFVTPSFIGALGWILLAAPNSGWFNAAWRGLSGAQAPLLNIYTMVGTIFVCSIYTVPYTFTMVASARAAAAALPPDRSMSGWTVWSGR